MFFEFQNFSASKLGFIIIQPSLPPQIQRRLFIKFLALAKLERLLVLDRNKTITPSQPSYEFSNSVMPSLCDVLYDKADRPSFQPHFTNSLNN